MIPEGAEAEQMEEVDLDLYAVRDVGDVDFADSFFSASQIVVLGEVAYSGSAAARCFSTGCASELERHLDT